MKSVSQGPLLPYTHATAQSAGLCFATLMLAATACLWRLVESYSDDLWRLASRAWEGLRRNALTRRLRTIPLE